MLAHAAAVKGALAYVRAPAIPLDARLWVEFAPGPARALPAGALSL